MCSFASTRKRPLFPRLAECLPVRPEEGTLRWRTGSLPERAASGNHMPPTNVGFTSSQQKQFSSVEHLGQLRDCTASHRPPDRRNKREVNKPGHACDLELRRPYLPLLALFTPSSCHVWNLVDRRHLRSGREKHQSSVSRRKANSRIQNLTGNCSKDLYCGEKCKFPELSQHEEGT
jgi:hypothetical protein